MGRKLALFFDGTWNTPGSDTNVVRLYRLTRSHASFRGTLLRKTFKKDPSPDAPGTEEQLKYYHRGVGTTWGSRMLGGMFGYGLSKNIRDGLLWLASHYRPGDDIYLFGFSRGAYTARSLAGLIGRCGIPREPIPGLVDTAYRFYRERVWDPDGIAIKAFRALALDEHRPDFAATVWTLPKERREPHSHLEQRWFPGSHADVGGGYSQGKLYQLPLRRMQERAAACGLEFITDAEIDPEGWRSPVHDSLREFAFGFYALLPGIYEHFRPIHMGVNEQVDDAVKRRVASGDCKDASGNRYDPPAMKMPEAHD